MSQHRIKDAALRVSRRDALKIAAYGLLGGACARRPLPTALPSRVIAPKAPVVTSLPTQPITTLCFGSCNKPSLDQPLWAKVLEQNPAVWIWLGDTVYADSPNVEVARGFYREQVRVPAYAALSAKTRIIGIWDDHDYGANDAGNNYPSRIESQQAFLDFVGEPKVSARRRQAGLYASYVIGSGAQCIKIILLDTRYHRETPGPDADVLGPEQWTWLEAELSDSAAALTVLGSSIQVISEDHGSEKWANFPRARSRLLDLLKRSPAQVVCVSGDRHFAELSRLEAADASGTLLELTSSGLTHSWTALKDEPNRHRVGHLYNGLNFGLVQVDWNAETFRLAALDRDGHPQIDYTTRLKARSGSR